MNGIGRSEISAIIIEQRRGDNTEARGDVSNAVGGEAYNATSETPVQLPTSDDPIEEPEDIFVPYDFKCPITTEIMLDPVNTKAGQVYERSWIQNWFEQQHRSDAPLTDPITRISCDDALTSNDTLKNSIQAFMEKHKNQLLQKEAHYYLKTAKKEENIKLLTSLLVGTDIKSEVLKVMMELTTDGHNNAENIRKKIANEPGLIEKLNDCLTSEDSELRELGLETMCNLSLEETNRKAPTEVEALEQHPNNAE